MYQPVGISLSTSPDWSTNQSGLVYQSVGTGLVYQPVGTGLSTSRDWSTNQSGLVYQSVRTGLPISRDWSTNQSGVVYQPVETGLSTSRDWSVNQSGLVYQIVGTGQSISRDWCINQSRLLSTSLTYVLVVTWSEIGRKLVDRPLSTHFLKRQTTGNFCKGLYSIPMCWLLCTASCFYNPELQFHICRDWIQKQLSVIFELCIRLCFMCPTNTLPGKTLSSRKGKLSALNYGFGIRDSLDDSQTVQTLEAFVEILDSVPPASSPYPTGSRSYEQSDVGSSHQIDMGW